MCGGSKQVSVITPKQLDSSVLPIQRAEADIVEIALEVLEATCIKFLDCPLLARVAKEEVDAQFTIHEHEDILAVVYRTLVKETDFVLHSFIAYPNDNLLEMVWNT